MVYEGYWAEGVRCGKGRAFYRERMVFEGEWYANKYWTGTGSLYVNDRVKFQGRWEQGVLVGVCSEFSQETGNLVFEGSYRYGERDGHGREFDPRTQEADNLVFEGRWINGCKWEGKGLEKRGNVVIESLWSRGCCLGTKEFAG